MVNLDITLLLNRILSTECLEIDGQEVLWVNLCLLKRHDEVLNPVTYECNLIWKWDL